MKFDKIIGVRTNKTIYRDGGHVIKLFDEDYSKADVLNEALNQARVEETGLPIPHVEEVTKIEGKWAIIAQFIEGKTLAQLMEENPDQRDAYMDRFIDIQAKVHAKRAPLLNKLKDKMDRKIRQTDLDATTRYELHTRLEAMPKHKKLCHGDFNPTNIIVGTDGIDYIIDWAHATQGNAGADAARTYMLFWLAGEIDGAKLYLDKFCRRCDMPRQYIEQWLPIRRSLPVGEGQAGGEGVPPALDERGGLRVDNVPFTGRGACPRRRAQR